MSGGTYGRTKMSSFTSSNAAFTGKWITSQRDLAVRYQSAGMTGRTQDFVSKLVGKIVSHRGASVSKKNVIKRRPQHQT